MSEPTYAQTVTRLAREYGHAYQDSTISRDDLESMTGKLMDAAYPAGISAADATADLFDEIDAGPVKMTPEEQAYAQYGISVGDQVALAISSEPDDVVGTVKRLYLDAIGSLAADVELRNGEIFPQNVEFLTRVGGKSPR